MKYKVLVHVVIGVILSIKRKLSGYSQVELAEVLKVNNSTLSKIEKGKIALTIDNLFEFLVCNGITFRSFNSIMQIVLTELSDVHNIHVYTAKHEEKNILNNQKTKEHIYADTLQKRYLRYHQPEELYYLFGVKISHNFWGDNYLEDLSKLESIDYKDIEKIISNNVTEIFQLIIARENITSNKEELSYFINDEYQPALKRYEKLKEKHIENIRTGSDPIENFKLFQKFKEHLSNYEERILELEQQIQQQEWLLENSKYKDYEF